MRHSHHSFLQAAPAKKRWTSPVLTSAELTIAELEFAQRSNQDAATLAGRLKAQGRI